MQETKHLQGVGEWRVHLPSNESAVAGLAFGRGGNSTRAEPASLAVDDVLVASATPLAADKPVKRVQRAKHMTPAATTAPSAPSEQAPAPVAAPPASDAPVQLAAADTSALQRYSERESQSKQQEQFRGGDAIVIGAGTLVVILLIVLLVLLLT